MAFELRNETMIAAIMYQNDAITTGVQLAIVYSEASDALAMCCKSFNKAKIAAVPNLYSLIITTRV